MMEATLLLATITQRFRLRSIPGHPVVLVPSFTLRPKYGMRMTLETRDSIAHTTHAGLQTQTTGQ
jgi:cytochrome P450